MKKKLFLSLTVLLLKIEETIISRHVWECAIFSIFFFFVLYSDFHNIFFELSTKRKKILLLTRFVQWWKKGPNLCSFEDHCRQFNYVSHINHNKFSIKKRWFVNLGVIQVFHRFMFMFMMRFSSWSSVKFCCNKRRYFETKYNFQKKKNKNKQKPLLILNATVRLIHLYFKLIQRKKYDKPGKRVVSKRNLCGRKQ